ncbi:MAG: signal peptidase II, partial [Pseudomonadota bacterium]
MSNAATPDSDTAVREISTRIWYTLAALLVVVDQLTKQFTVSELVDEGRSVAVTANFNWVLAYNPGAAFSFLSEAGGWQRWFFTVLSAVISIVLIIWLKRMPTMARWLPCAVALILSGA